MLLWTKYWMRRKFRLERTCRENCFAWLAHAFVLRFWRSPANAAGTVPREVRIGLVAPLSGELAATNGEPARRASELAVRGVNEAGGLRLGSVRAPVVLEVGDNKDNPEESVAAARRLITQKGVAAIVGPYFSRNAIPVAQLAQRVRIPMISPTSTNPETTAGKDFVFRACFNDDIQGEVLARFVFEDLGVRRAAALYDESSAYNRTLAVLFRKAFEGLGGEMAAFETYTADRNRDFSRQLTVIREAAPGALLLPNYDDDVPVQALQAKKLGLSSRLVGGDAWDSMTAEEFRLLDGAFFTTMWANDPGNPKNAAFVAAYEKAYGEAPGEMAAMTFDAFGLLFTAIESQGSAEPEAVRKGLSEITDFEGVSGRIGFHGSGDPQRSVVIKKVQDGVPVFDRLAAP